MRALANLFMWMFLIDGCLSVADELLRYNSADDGLLGLRLLIAFAVVTQAFIVYVGLLFDRRLPKLILLPQTLFAFWGMTGLWPLPFFILSDNLGVIIAGLQVSLGLLPFFVLRGEGKGWLLRREQFEDSGFSTGNLLMGIGGTIILVPIFLVLFAGAGSVEFIRESTGGFVTIDSRGISMEERTYRRGDKTVRLTSMIHVGDQAYYDQFAASVKTPRTLILAEGVTDHGGLLASKFSYDQFAGALGLSSQQYMPLQGELIDAAELERPAEQSDLSEPHILHADLDTADFDPGTIEFLNVLGREVFGSEDMADGMLAYNEWVDQHMDQGRYETLMHDVITLRNENVVSYLERSLDKYDVIVIPWGALHMRGIEEGVLEQGFKLKDVEARLSVNFAEVDFGAVWQGMSR